MGKMNIGQLKAREICEGIKNGFGVAHFCVKYDCTEQEFETRLKQLYSKNERDKKRKLSALKANDEKLSKKAKAKTSAPETEKLEVPEDLPVTDEATTETAEETVTVETATLEQLKDMEATLSDERMALESEHKAKTREHRACAAKTREQKKRVEEIEIMLQDLKKEYLNTTTQDNQLITEMNELSAKHYEKTVEIQKVRSRIKELSRIVLFVYGDGTIAAENSDLVLDESGSDELYRELAEKNECAELRIKDIKVLARVMIVYSRLPENMEIVFDNAEIEEVFRLLSA